MNFIFDFSKDVGQQLGQRLCKLDPFKFQRMNMIYKRLYKELIDILGVQRFLLFRSEIDLHTIDKVYKAKYGIYLSDDVKRIYYGEYADALLKLLKKEEIPDIYQHSIPLPLPLLLHAIEP
ncbi:unnamed protein product [Schistosoma rodhaini]|uniref:Uncharacterized protein n=1 Tax=Schistosoma rodhaini TaxID=6188 RepID=A0AA85GLE7_9TREM|nr:unnamed protein product [Schistosoma rodhaini]